MATTEPSEKQGGRLAVTLTACGGTFLAMLDSTVTNLAIPAVGRAVAFASVTDLSWIISGYIVMFAALLAPAGRLSDAIGRRRMFVIGVGLFTAASLLCALAPDLGTLVAARVLQGAGAAAMIPASLAILLVDGPADRRSSSIGIWSAASAVAAALGPALGGVLVELFGWRSVFVINLPVGIVLILAARYLLTPSAPIVRGRLPDPIGTVLIAVGVGGLTLGLTQSGVWGWVDLRTAGLLLVGVVPTGTTLSVAEATVS